PPDSGDSALILELLARFDPAQLWEAKEKARRIAPAGPFATARVTAYRAAVLGRVGMVIFTVSPFCPGKPVNSASIRPGTTTSSRLVSDRAWARPSNKGAFVPCARMCTSSSL